MLDLEKGEQRRSLGRAWYMASKLRWIERTNCQPWWLKHWHFVQRFWYYCHTKAGSCTVAALGCFVCLRTRRMPHFFARATSRTIMMKGCGLHFHVHMIRPNVECFGDPCIRMMRLTKGRHHLLRPAAKHGRRSKALDRQC